MSQRKATISVEDLSSLPPRTLQAALKVSGEREAEKRKGGGSRRIKILEIRMLEAKLKGSENVLDRPSAFKCKVDTTDDFHEF